MSKRINNKFLNKYLKNNKFKNIDSSAVAFYSSLDHINSVSSVAAKDIIKEFYDQRNNLKLIASENYCSLAVQFAQGNLLTDKYAEGFSHHRFYAGCDNVDNIEEEANRLACKLFGAQHAYLQPHSGSDANLIAFTAILSAKIEKPLVDKLGVKNISNLSRQDWDQIRKAMTNNRLLAMDYYSGGHLTHGYRHNFSSILFDAYSYSVDKNTKCLNLDDIYKQLKEIKPLIFLAGYSAYPRKINFAKLRQMCDEVGAVFMVDMAHFAGLVAGKVFTGEFDPVAYADVVTLTTHKTLRGPRGGMVLCKKEYAQWIDKGCPMIMGGPLPHVMVAKLVALKEASTTNFQKYAHKIVENAQSLAQSCINEGMPVLTGGTDNHLLLIDVSQGFNLSGRQAESALRECNITLNRNALPFDPNGPWYTSGLRIGSPAITTLGMGKKEMVEIAKIIKLVLSNVKPEDASKDKKNMALYKLDLKIKKEASTRVLNLLTKYPLYPNIDINILL